MEQTPAITKDVSLDISCAQYNQMAVISALALQYSVDPSLISISNPCGASNLRIRSLQSSGSITLTITIATTGTAADGTPISSPVADLLSRVENVNDATLGASLGTALGTSVTVTASSAPSQGTVTRTASSVCPKGKWCTAGLVVDCPIGTYNNRTAQNFATACTRCPEFSTTANVSSTSITDCVCQEGFVQTTLADGSSKCECAAGMGIVNEQSCSACPIGSYKPMAGNVKV